LGNIRLDLRQYRHALHHYRQSKVLYTRLHQTAWVIGAITNMGSCYEKLNVLDSALMLQRQATALIAGLPPPGWPRWRWPCATWARCRPD
jgi:two-component system NtrC family sensor kinase